MGGRVLFRAVAFVCLCIGVFVACGSDDSDVIRAQLAQGCLIDSDCNSPFVCAFKTCHQACNTDTDCKDLGARCVISDRPFNVCQPPIPCSYNTQCPGNQVCGVDGQCRDQCKADKDCITGQLCTTGSCANPTELVDGGLPTPDGGVPNEGQSCSYNSDCAYPLVCRNGGCAYQCKADIDCPLGQSCVNHLCVLPNSGGDGGVCIPKTCNEVGANCGTTLDGCGGVLTCGTGPNGGCAAGTTCGGGGKANICGNGSCVAQDCSQLGATCGFVSDGCGTVLNCGGCSAFQTCGGSGIQNRCGCTRDDAAACAGKNCGDVVDNCGISVSCGGCSAPSSCGGGGAANQCGCKKVTCAELGKNCGTIPDGCGGSLNCGNCASGNCGGGGSANVCGGNACTPTTCAAIGAGCGIISDGCGSVLNCDPPGGCPAGKTCGGGGTANQCGCTARTCAGSGANCDAISDGCGGTLNCGSCGGVQTCGGAGAPNVCGCQPRSCTALNYECGLADDGCGSALDCGVCPAGKTCGGSGVPHKCGVPSTGKSCANTPAICGPAHTDDCCAADKVVGSVFNRKNDNTGPDGKYPARVSDFYMDRYEVTVARFRKFLNAPDSLAYASSPFKQGAGANPHISGYGNSGWDTSWNTEMPVNASAYASRFNGYGSSTWTDVAGGSESWPINFVSWYEAFAFCIWDGGRLPTENEWLYDALGGTQYRYYPWSNPPSSTTFTNCVTENAGGCGPGSENYLIAVGSQSGSGDSRWGTRNLGGNAREWTLDIYNNNYLWQDCSQGDCADLQSNSGSRVYYANDVNAGLGRTVDRRSASGPNNTGDGSIGFRCARDK